MNKILKEFSCVVNQPFSLGLISTASNTLPIEVSSEDVLCSFAELSRVNNMLVKVGAQPLIVPDGIAASVVDWMKRCLGVAGEVCGDIDERYVYLTVDNKPVGLGESQRVGGWHLDGLQGDEVPEKLNNCFQFLWVSDVPTEFCKQSFDSNGLDVSKHNIFDSLGSQVEDKNCFTIKAKQTYLMHCYHLHRATQATKDTERLFLRLYISHCPVTRKGATINPLIEYPFTPHVASGEIPSHLLKRA